MKRLLLVLLLSVAAPGGEPDDPRARIKAAPSACAPDSSPSVV